MKLKIDENLPAGCAVLLRNAGFEADTVFDERLAGADDAIIASRAQAENRVLVTLDLDFGNVQAYPPSQHAGIIVLRPRSHASHNSGADEKVCIGAHEPDTRRGTLDRRTRPDSVSRRIEKQRTLRLLANSNVETLLMAAISRSRSQPWVNSRSRDRL